MKRGGAGSRPPLKKNHAMFYVTCACKQGYLIKTTLPFTRNSMLCLLILPICSVKILCCSLELRWYSLELLWCSVELFWWSLELLWCSLELQWCFIELLRCSLELHWCSLELCSSSEWSSIDHSSIDSLPFSYQL